MTESLVIALTLQVQDAYTKQPLQDITVKIASGTVKTSGITSKEGLLVVNDKLIPGVKTNQMVNFSVNETGYEPFKFEIPFPAKSEVVKVDLIKKQDLQLTIVVETGDICREASIVVNTKTHVFKSNTKNCTVTFKSTAL